jgi:hypothetical protein
MVFTYVTRPETAQFDEVTWINEHPAIVRIEPLLECSTKCARISALALGIAQLRPFAIVNGGKIEAPYQLRVVE